jgi:hypothetical protein
MPRSDSMRHGLQLPSGRLRPALSCCLPTCATGCRPTTWPGSCWTWSTSSTLVRSCVPIGPMGAAIPVGFRNLDVMPHPGSTREQDRRDGPGVGPPWRWRQRAGQLRRWSLLAAEDPGFDAVAHRGSAAPTRRELPQGGAGPRSAANPGIPVGPSAPSAQRTRSHSAPAPVW